MLFLIINKGMPFLIFEKWKLHKVNHIWGGRQRNVHTKATPVNVCGRNNLLLRLLCLLIANCAYTNTGASRAFEKSLYRTLWSLNRRKNYFVELVPKPFTTISIRTPRAAGASANFLTVFSNIIRIKLIEISENEFFLNTEINSSLVFIFFSFSFEFFFFFFLILSRLLPRRPLNRDVIILQIWREEWKRRKKKTIIFRLQTLKINKIRQTYPVKEK